MKKTIAIIILACSLQLAACSLEAAGNDDQLVSLTKQIMDAKSNEGLYVPFAQLKDIYFQGHRYNEFADFLKSLNKKKKALAPFVDYYTALCRYQQLKYLEESQDWNEYFSGGNEYRKQVEGFAQKAVDTTTLKDPLNLYARLLLYKFAKDEQTGFAEEALSGLTNAASEYAKDAGDINPIKEIAAELYSLGERSKSRELYKAYVDKILTQSAKSESLAESARNFYKEGNLELSELIYDAYIQRIVSEVPKEEVIPVLIGIAKDFMYQDGLPNDPVYAEKVFKKIEELGGKEAFDQELIYLRAFNLEKIKEYPQSKDIYLELIQRYSESNNRDEAEYKAAIIYTYALRDIKEGKARFEKLAQKEFLTPQVISSIYHLGLLNQWENDTAKAKEYYAKLLDKAGASFQDTVSLVKERLKEIEEAKPIEYNLKTFLDVSLKEEHSSFDTTKANLKASVYRLKKNQEDIITSGTPMPETGCMQVEVQYLWSGNLGKTKPQGSEPSFNTAYADTGTKEINLVVISPTGIIDRNLDMVDVY